jgi:hypothetical protein
LFLVWFGALSFWEQIFGFLKISGFEDFSKYFQHDLSSLRLDLVPNIASNYNLKLFIKLVVFNKCTMSKIKYRVFIVMCSQLKLMQLFFDPIKLGESSTQFFFHDIDKLRKEKDCCKLVPRLQLSKLMSFFLYQFLWTIMSQSMHHTPINELFNETIRPLSITTHSTPFELVDHSTHIKRRILGLIVFKGTF